MSVNLVRKFVINRFFGFGAAGRKGFLETFLICVLPKDLKNCGILPMISALEFKA